MREIKFRAWDEENSKMMYSQNGYFYRESGTRFQITTDGKCNAVYLEESVTCDPVLMQFTGLKDKNGKEIYEGDIMYYHGKKGTVERSVYELTGTSGIPCWVASGLVLTVEKESKICKGEVIGNKFENPELLETEAA